MSDENLRAAVTMGDPDHLRAWVRLKRPWVIFRGDDLVEALPWPDGHEHLQQIIACYRDLRRTIPTGETRKINDFGDEVEVPLCKDEKLTVEEMDRAVRWLIAQIRETHPKWDLADPEM